MISYLDGLKPSHVYLPVAVFYPFHCTLEIRIKIKINGMFVERQFRQKYR